eukprot:TRINITY_DN1618_c0_g1_i8.p1 TRINITY_DN1618_c0_g1~~TRINITY_DN1618_c0_g1_i8.p1  ORF type:complete len:588 (+),score=124.16 TRINITY_DN1618_c0_g1_i8:1394-3157(+)
MIEELKSKTKLIEERNISLEEKAKEMQKLFDSLSNRHQDSLSLIERKEKELTELNEKNITLTRTNDELEDSLARTREKVEKGRGSTFAEVKAYIEENSRLRTQIAQLKEQLSENNVKVRVQEEEVEQARGNIEQLLIEKEDMNHELQKLRQKVAELSIINTKFQDEASEILANKASLLHTASDKLENTEKLILNLRNQIKENEKEKQRLIKKFESTDEVKVSWEKQNAELIQIISQKEREVIESNNRAAEISEKSKTMARNLEESLAMYKLTKADLEQVQSEHEKAKNTIQSAAIDIQRIIPTLTTFSETYKHLIESSDGTGLGSPKVIDIINKIEELSIPLRSQGQNRNLGAQSIDEATRLMAELVKTVLEDFELNLRKAIDMRQELRIAKQRIQTLERKCYFLNNDEVELRERHHELRREFDQLQDKKSTISREKADIYLREEKVERENQQLRIELNRVTQAYEELVRELDNFQHKKREPLDHKDLSTLHDLEGRSVSYWKQKYAVLAKEKQNLSAVLENVINLVSSAEAKKTIHEIMKVVLDLSLIHISEPTRLLSISYAVFCLKKKNIKANYLIIIFLHRYLT